jgi:hypothetical protein
MKALNLYSFLIFYFITFSLYSQITGDTVKISIKRRNTVISWQNFTRNDTDVYKLSNRINATVKSKNPISEVELNVNGISDKDFEIINAGSNYRVKIDKEVNFSEGVNEVFITAKTENEKLKSDVKTIHAKKNADKPEIFWISPFEKESGQLSSETEIKFQIKSVFPVDSIQVFLNGNLNRGFTLIEKEQDKNDITIRYKIKLQTDSNSVYIIARNSGGTAISEPRYIQFKSEIIDQKRVALVIGNSNYKSGNKLENPKNDAADMASALKRLNFDVDLLIDADQKPLGMAVDRFGEKAKNADIAFFYYAGHGVQVNGNNYLIPVDADVKEENQVKYACLDANQVLANLEFAESKVNIIVMDACRDNPFERSWTRSTKGRGLATMDAPVGSLVAYATQPGNTAADGNGKNGLYTSALLKYIERSDLSLFEVFMNVRIKVLEDSEKRQQPWESSSLTKNVYLLK